MLDKLTAAVTTAAQDHGLNDQRFHDFLHVAAALEDDPVGDAGRALRDGAPVLLELTDDDLVQVRFDDFVADLLAEAVAEAARHEYPQHSSRFTFAAIETIAHYDEPVTDARFIITAHWIGSLTGTPAAATLHDDVPVELPSDGDEVRSYWLPVGELLAELLAGAAASSIDHILTASPDDAR